MLFQNLLIRNFKVGDAFVGYQKDTPAAVVFQVSHLLKDQTTTADKEDAEHWKAKVIITCTFYKILLNFTCLVSYF